MTKLNRATYAILLDVSPIVDPENNVLQHYMESDIVQLGLWGNVVEKNMRVKGTEFENLGFSFELPKSLMGIRGAVRVMRVEYDHYSKVSDDDDDVNDDYGVRPLQQGEQTDQTQSCLQVCDYTK